MTSDGCIVVVGGTAGIGKELARHYAGTGRETVITGRVASKAEAVAAEIGGNARGIGFDLARPKSIRAALASVGPVRYLAIVAIQRDDNTIRDFDIDRAMVLVTLKLVGYAEVVHVLLDRLLPDSSIVLFGGQAKDRPYPGSTTVSTVNGGIAGLARSLAWELAPIRVNVIHPGITGDSPYWHGKPPAILEGHLSRTITKRLATMDDIVDGTRFLLENPSVDGIDLVVDNGRLMY
jgi:NAD(P)-dependent dehydrogenase (short-subunit alcohol dehydrogenase family)